MKRHYAVLLLLFCWSLARTQINCNNAQELLCSTEVTSSNISGCYNHYNGPYCNSNDAQYTGREKVFKINVTTSQTAYIALTDCTADLDLYLVNGCSPQSCVASSSTPGGNEFISTSLSPGTYYLIIDGWSGAASTFKVTYKCESTPGDLDCATAKEIICGQAISSTNADGDNKVVGPYCGRHCNYTGKEKIYTFTVSHTGTYTVKLSGLTADLDMFLMNACSRNACESISGQPSNTTETITALLTPDTYYIVIDGYKGATSPYTLNLTCPNSSPPIDCNSLVSTSYAGNGSDLKFNFKFNTNLACTFKGWRIGATTYTLSPNVNFIFQTPGTYTVCADYLDLATNTIKSCCRTICANLPTNCEQKIQYAYVNGKYVLSLEGNAANYSNVKWRNDTDKINLDPNNVAADCRNLTVSVSYYDNTTNCWAICCKRISFCPPTSCQDNISAQYVANGNKFIFSFSNPTATNQTWFFDGANTTIPSGIYNLPQGWTCAEKSISVVYYDTASKCWRVCCKKIFLCPPVDCEKAIDYQYNSATNKFIFSLSVPNAGNNTWSFEEGNVTLPNGEFVVPQSYTCGNKTVKVEYYDLVNQVWRTCTRVVYICPPVNCQDNINFQYVAAGNKFAFTLNGYSNSDVIWKFEDDQTILPNGIFALPNNWVCKDRILQAFYYSPASQCWLVCSKNVTICPPDNCQSTIDFNYVENGNKMIFSLNVPGATNLHWKIDEGNIVIPGGVFTFLPSWICGSKTISVIYYDPASKCWRSCCKMVNVCPATSCGSNIDYAYSSQGNKYIFSLLQANATQVSWYFSDGSPISGGEFVIPAGYVCGNKTVMVKYYIAATKTWHVCQKTIAICPPEQCESSISYDYNNAGNKLTFQLSGNVSNAEWTMIEGNITLPNGVFDIPTSWVCGEKTILVKYLDNNINCHKICAKKVYVCPPTNCEAAIEHTYQSADNKLHFNLAIPGVNNVTWKLLPDNIVLPNGDFTFPENWTCADKTILVSYYNPATKCWAQCSKSINVCPPSNCQQSISYAFNAGGNALTFELDLPSATQVLWVLDETKVVLGQGIKISDISLPNPCGIYTATAIYKVNGVWNSCCKKINMCNPYECGTSITHTIGSSNIELTLPAGSSEATWLSNLPIAPTGNSASIALPSTSTTVTVTASYFSSTLKAYTTCKKDISVSLNNTCTCDPDDYTGWAVATCNAKPGTNQPVGMISDIRNTTTAPKGADWGPQINTLHPTNWTIDQIGQVFGITMDQYNNVFLAASDVYDTQYNSDPYGPGQIFKARPENNFIAEPFIALSNSGGALNGIGDVIYNKENDVLYASNLEDGKIYRISALGVIIDTYDPWANDDSSQGITVSSEQVWALGLNKEGNVQKIYFPRIGNGERAMYSITLNTDGSFPSVDSEVKEFDNIMGVGLRISDIAFDANGGKMIFAERGTKFTTGAHDSKVMAYSKTGSTWTMSIKYFAGAMVNDVFPGLATATGENAGGGVDFGAAKTNSSNIEGCDQLAWASTNWFRTPDGKLLYGMQGMNANGNNPHNAAVNPNITTDLMIDYDGQVDNYNQKGDLGDVEIFRCNNACTPPKSLFGFTNNNGAYQFINQSQGATSYTWDFNGGIVVTGTNTSANPEVVFAHSGSYNICLTATNSCGVKTSCQTIQVSNNNGCGFGMGPQLCGSVGQEILIPVTTSNFNDIIAFNFSIKSDQPTLVQLIGTELYHPAIASGNNSYTDQNGIRFFWSDPSGKTIANGTTLFYIRAKILQSFYTPVSISFVNNPVKIECFNSAQQPVPLNLASGSICYNQNVAVSGNINGYDDKPVSNVQILVNNQMNLSNNIGGNYEVTNLTMGNTYNVKPYKNINHVNGLNGLDIVRLQRHILQIELLDSPYKIIAADVNNDKVINALDVVNLQKIILRMVDEFPNNTSWRFVPKSYTFTTHDILKESYPESVNYSPLMENKVAQDFVAIKVGDLHLSAEASNIIGENIIARSVLDTLALMMKNQYKELGQSISIPITVKNFKNVLSLENTITWDASLLQFDGITDMNLPQLSMSNFGTNLTSEGKLPFIWYDANLQGVSLDDNKVLFQLNFTPTALFHGETTVSIGGQPLTMLAVNSNMEELPYTINKSKVAIVTALSANIIKQNVKCFGNADGSIELDIIGGTSNYIYDWSNGSTSSTIVDLNQGIYSCTVTDAFSNQQIIISEIVTSPETLQAIISTTLQSSNLYTITTDVTGGIAPYNYQWSNGNTSQNINNVEAGTYQLNITDANGCVVRTETNIVLSAIKDENFNVLFTVYPNPTKEFLHINSKLNSASEYHYTLLNNLGQIVLKGRSTSNTTLNLQELNNGLYHLILKNGTSSKAFTVYKVE
jgi:PKD repeat protein